MDFMETSHGFLARPRWAGFARQSQGANRNEEIHGTKRELDERLAMKRAMEMLIYII